MEHTKVCTSCKQILRLTDFYLYSRRGAKKKSIRSKCKQCDIRDINENKKFKQEYYDEWRKKHLAKPEVQRRVKAYRQLESTKRLRRICYQFYRLLPEWVERRKAQEKAKYERLRNDPVRVARRRELARLNYHKRRAKKAAETTNEQQHI